MRVIIQRVNEASVKIDHKIKAEINKGYLILVSFENNESEADLVWCANKICNLRIFNDSNNKMNLSIIDIDGEILLISQFTLFASTKKGNRPSFMRSENPDVAIVLYEKFIKLLASKIAVKTGVFGADMKVSLVNDGPVTIFIDTKNKE